MALLGGDLVTAMRIMSSARSTLVDVSPVFAAVCDVDRAEVLRDAGHTIEAERILAQAATVFGRQRMPQSRGRGGVPPGTIPARPRSRSGAPRRRPRGSTIPHCGQRRRGRRERRRCACAPSSAAARSCGPAIMSRAPRRVPARSDVEGASGELERFGFGSEAAALRMTHELWRARRVMTASGPRPGHPGPGDRVDGGAAPRLRSACRPRVRARSPRVRLARRRPRGLPSSSAWLSDFGSLDLQTSAVMQGNGLIRVGLDSAIRSGRPEVVFEWSEWARHMSLQVIPLRPPPDGQLADDLAELRMLRGEGGDWQSDPRARDLRDACASVSGRRPGPPRSSPARRSTRCRPRSTTRRRCCRTCSPETRSIVLVVTRERREHASRSTDGAASAMPFPALRADLDMAASDPRPHGRGRASSAR